MIPGCSFLKCQSVALPQLHRFRLPKPPLSSSDTRVEQKRAKQAGQNKIQERKEKGYQKSSLFFQHQNKTKALHVREGWSRSGNESKG
jgi:hypothetical protein